jgi:hypothetical protein
MDNRTVTPREHALTDMILLSALIAEAFAADPLLLSFPLLQVGRPSQPSCGDSLALYRPTHHRFLSRPTILHRPYNGGEERVGKDEEADGAHRGQLPR